MLEFTNMESENNNIEVQVEVQKGPLNCVTPLSKYLAMVLFILTPFIGGWIGYQYAPEKVVEVERVKEVPSRVSKVDSVDSNKQPTDLSVFSGDMESFHVTTSDEYDQLFTKYPTYTIRTVEYGDVVKVLSGIDSTGTIHDISFVEIASQPISGSWMYYMTYRPNSDAASRLSFAFNTITSEIKQLKTARLYQDTWFFDSKRISPDGLKLASISKNWDENHTRTLYMIDLSLEAVREIKTLPEYETFIKYFGGLGSAPTSNVVWVDNETVQADIYDNTQLVNEEGGEVHPFLRTELIKI